MLVANAALVSAEQPALQQARDTVHARHHDMRGIALLAHDRALVLVAALRELPIRLPAVGVDRRAGLDRLVDEWQQAIGGDVGHMLEPDPPESLGCLISTAIATIALVSVLRPSTPPSTREVPLVDLNVTREPLATRADHRRAIAVQHRPRGLVGTQPERTLNPERRHPVLLARHLPRRREPQPQRSPGAMKDRPRGHRRLTPADPALPAPTPQPPPVPAHAPRTPDALRPAQPLEVIQARRVVREPRQQPA